MPYEIAFTKQVETLARDLYINECCVGGDAVVDRLLPVIQSRYGPAEGNQEDWGWFVWFKTGDVSLAIDVFTEDPVAGTFRVHLTSRRKRYLFLDTIVDTAELDQLRDLVLQELANWCGSAVAVTHLDRNYNE